MEGMTSNHPYLVRALYEWISDNNLTPQIVVNAEMEGVVVPREHIQDGHIVLNISSRATDGLEIGNDVTWFRTRFGGVSYEVSLPTAAILAVVARENGAGMSFPAGITAAAGEDEPVPPDDEPKPPSPGGNRPKLRVVK